MDPPKSKTTIRITTNMGTASQYVDSPMTVVEVKGRTPQEKGEHYLQLSLGALKELAGLLEDTRLSEGDKAPYNKTYDYSMARYDDMVRLRNRLVAQKKSFRRFLVNLFVRESEASRFYRMSYWNYSTIKRTSDELHRRLLPVRGQMLAASGSIEESGVSVHEENPPDVVEGNVLIKDLLPNQTLEGINLDVYSKEEENEAFAILNQIGTLAGGQDEDDDGATVRPSTTQSRPPSPSLSCTVIYNININNSILSLNSDVTGATVAAGVNEGAATATHSIHTDANDN